MVTIKTMLIALLAVSTCIPAIAQVRTFDTEFPEGPVQSLIERGELPAGVRREESSLQGRLLYPASKKHKHKHKGIKLKTTHRADDTLYGKTINLQIGAGGAHVQ